jgi:Uma2 family endonuclease
MSNVRESPSPVSRLKMSYEEFLESYDGEWAEWVDGEVVLMSPPSTRHQRIARFLNAVLQTFVEAKQLGETFPAPFQMKTDSHLSGREPDLIYVANENVGRLKKNHLDGPADLVVEIISPDSVTRDRRDKFQEYERGGVLEYWIIDPIRETADFFVLKDGRYQSVPIRDGIYHSTVLNGLWLRVEWLRQEPLPLLMNVLKEWKLV